jgi:polysaccharide export outer membrane protein
MKRTKILLVLLFFVLATHVLASEKKERTPIQKGVSKSEESRAKSIVNRYTIQPEDVLEIFVYKEPSYSREVTVRPDGKITLPMVQDIQAAGLTPPELKKQMEDRLREFVNTPNVTVMVQNINSYKIYTVGKILNQGVLTLQNPVTVLQALSMVGGFEESAKQDEIVIIRGGNKETSIFKFNFKEVVKGRDLHQNIVLEPGDVLIVP